MPRYDFTSPRLYVDAPLREGIAVDLDKTQTNSRLNAMQLKQGETILVFNGTDGEWVANVHIEGRGKTKLVPTRLARKQTPASSLHYIFAPLKQARQDYMVQKAVEMGAGQLQPVLTQFTQISKVNLERMNANAIEAAEQCGIISLPVVKEAITLEGFVQDFPANRHLIFCDEDEESQSPQKALKQLALKSESVLPVSILIGPECGFSEIEREMLRSHSQTTAIALGPRVLRADTAAVAALAVVQMLLGDWKN